MGIMRFLGMTLMATFLTVSVNAQDTKQVFIYSPGEREGLHIAQETADGWQEIGQDAVHQFIEILPRLIIRCLTTVGQTMEIMNSLIIE